MEKCATVLVVCSDRSEIEISAHECCQWRRGSLYDKENGEYVRCNFREKAKIKQREERR